MSVPRVSVIVPSYNHAPYLDACLQSVRAQSFEDWELILIDDGSTDDSFAIAQLLAAEDHRIRCFRNDANLGTYGTEAKAVSLALGEFVAVLNSDDLWEPSKLAGQVTLLERNPLMPCCYTLGWLADREGNIRQEDVHANWPTDFVQETLPFLLSENRILASSVMFRAGNARFDPSLRYSGDWVALLKAAIKAPIGCVPARLSHWRQHATNTYRRSPAQVSEEIRVRSAILDDESRWFTPRIPAEQIRAGLSRCSLDLAALMVLCNRSGEARHSAFRALRLAPNRHTALRRLGLCLLPNSVARRRLWPKDAEFVGVPEDHQSLDWDD